MCDIKSNLKVHDGKPFKRLPRNVVPTHYDLFLKPDLEKFVFEGTVAVNLEIKEPTNTIVLNCLELQVKDVVIQCKGEPMLEPSSVALSNELETLTLAFPKVLQPGRADLKMSFAGEITDKMKGLYRSKYISPSGEERFAAVTQFEATDARRCFPCWDEPAIKATFDITLAVPHSRVALSNMPVVHESQENDLRTLKFDTTPIMSTYLVAVVVGEYDFIEDISKDGVLVRVYTPVGKKEQGRFALEVATKVLPYYKEYFNIAYPLPKIDLIAIADFSAGAMENWGLVTYRETCLLVDPENTSAIRKQWIAIVVGHELAHQWFGNLVTMEWWTHLWLNEGYASFVEFLCVEHLFPEYDIWTQFVTDTYCKALELDCLDNSHPIEVPVGHPSEIDEIFDDISYNKGASVIRMLHKYIGDEDFRKGMNIYLKRHQYKNTYTEDLWAALEEASNKPVAAVMSTWTKQMGFPVVRVKVDQGPDSTLLTLSQERFCVNKSCKNPDVLWMVPITVSTAQSGGSEVISIVLQTKSTVVSLNVPKDSWIKINPGTIGYYRTQYPPELLERFLPAIRDKSLPPLDRLGLLDDLFALVQAGETPTVEVLKVMEAFSNEDNYTVWSSINNCLAKLSLLLSHTDLKEDLKRYMRVLMTPIYKKLGWEPKENESHLDTLLRSLIIGSLASCGEESVVEESKVRFASHLSKKCLISADLRGPVYRAVMSCGNEKTYDDFLTLYREADLHEEKNRICRNLGAIKDEAILKKVLTFAISEEVRSQDSVFVITSVAALSSVGRDLAWNFFKDNWEELLKRYEGGFLLARLVKFTTENFASEEKALEVEQFFGKHKFPGTERTVQQSLETIRLNEAWLKRDENSIRAFLTRQG
ncbi:hypothetical protein RUM44_003133 [Polyplax serrata]|uniref:Aminopeptidase n=1 Tax=Polyplax serrata TaxID=468196 RepID=A0ABR1AXN8_POLSC